MIIHYSDNKNTAGIVRHSCGILFILFSFCYLYFLQGELISKAQYVFSNGMTTYSIFWGALIITVVLRIIQIPAEKFVTIPLRYYALTYIPSFLVLSVICDVNHDVFENFSLGWWWLGIPFVLCLFYFLSKFAVIVDTDTKDNQRGYGSIPYLWPNFIILIIVMVFCGTCHSATDVDMYEQKIERLLLEKDYDKALNVGLKSVDSNLRLTNLRMYALSKTGKLPQCLFEYPQYYGLDGLLCVTDTSSHCYRFDSSDICSYIGVPCDSSIHDSEQYFKKMSIVQLLVSDSIMDIERLKSEHNDSLDMMTQYRYERLKNRKKIIDDYILCGLLLKRDIDAFKDHLEHSFIDEERTDSIVLADSLPKAYREALVMVTPEVCDTAMIKAYGSYLEMKAAHKDSTISSNMTRRKYGNTFWWYYYNPSVTHVIHLP